MTENTPTPSTEDVREAYAFIGRGIDFRGVAVEQGKAFDRWLAAVKEAVWDDVLDEIEENEINTAQAREGNPYRIEREAQG